MTDEELIEKYRLAAVTESDNRMVELARLGMAKVPPADCVEVKIAVAVEDGNHVAMQSCDGHESTNMALQDLITWIEGTVTHAAIVTAYIPRIQVNQVDGEAS